MKHSMEEAFEALRGERAYQDRLWEDAPSKSIHSVAEWILYMEDYLAEARSISSRRASPESDEAALHVIRKVAAMGVACMEQNGVFRRDMSDLDEACELHGVGCDRNPFAKYTGRRIRLPDAGEMTGHIHSVCWTSGSALQVLVTEDRHPRQTCHISFDDERELEAHLLD